MRDIYVKKIIFVIIAISIIGAVFLYSLSDRRIEAAKRISYVFDVDISKNAKRDKEIYREASFHGDGISAVQLIVPSDEMLTIIKDLNSNKDLKKLDRNNDYLKSYTDYVMEKGMAVRDLDNYEIYSKTKNKGTSVVEYFANCYLLLVDKNKGELIFIDSDTWFLKISYVF